MDNEKFENLSDKIASAAWRGGVDAVPRTASALSRGGVGSVFYVRAAFIATALLALAVSVIRIVLFSERYYDRTQRLYAAGGVAYVMYAAVLLAALAVIALSGATKYANSRVIHSTEASIVATPRKDIAGGFGALLSSTAPLVLAALLAVYPFMLAISQFVAPDTIGHFGGTMQMLAFLFAPLAALALTAEQIVPHFAERAAVKARSLWLEVIGGVCLLGAAGFFAVQLVSMNLYIADPLLRSPVRYFFILSCAAMTLFFVAEAKIRVSGESKSKIDGEERRASGGLWLGLALLVFLLGTVSAVPSLLCNAAVSAPERYFHVIELSGAGYAATRILTARVEINDK